MKKIGLLITSIIFILSACRLPEESATNTAVLETRGSHFSTTIPLETRVPPTVKPARASPHSTYTPTSSIEDMEEMVELEDSVLFIFGDGFDYRHYEGTRKALERNGYAVRIASTTLEPIKGNITVHGFEIISRPWQTAPPVKADLLLKDVRVSDFKGIVFISDRGILSDPPPEVEGILRNAAQFGTVLAAQEFGVYLIADAGLLAGIKVTANPLICREMEVNYNAICTLMPVQRDDGIVTADPTMSTVSFARAIVGEIEGHKP